MSEDRNEYFSTLNGYPSFQDLDKTSKKRINSLITDIYDTGIREKWLIEFPELSIRYPRIAEGTHSDVFDCVWRDSTIVLKKPKFKKIKALENSLNEVKLWSTLRHPNLVQFLGASFDFVNNNFYILLQKVGTGLTLQNLLADKNRTMNASLKNSITSQLIHAIKFLHKCNPPIIYRDLKPDNIMLDEFNQLKLTDFGLSRFMPEEEDYAMTGETGTIRYMAPEVYLKQPYGLKADVYSLGLILYYLTTRQKPFQEYNTDTVKTYFNTPDLIFSTQKVKSSKIRTVINKCIEKNLDLRWDIDELSNNIIRHNKEHSCQIS